MKIESHTGAIPENEDKIFNFLSDFQNIESMVPKDNLNTWEFTKDSCKLGITGIGQIGLKIVDKEPNKLIKIISDSESAYKFTLWIQLKQLAEKDTRVKLTLQADLNLFLQAMVKNPLQQFVNTIVDKMKDINYG
jgi:carbon monoxide dehydrogenase subunit G